MEQLEVHRRKRTGCSSPDFLQEGEAILTLAELFRKGVGTDWQAQVSRLPNLASRVRWMADTTRQLTGLDRFGEYLTALFEADMLFGNEDRHLNNIAVLRRGGGFAYCPFFDFGAGLLSNTRDFPLDIVPQSACGAAAGPAPGHSLWPGRSTPLRGNSAPNCDGISRKPTSPPPWRRHSPTTPSETEGFSGTGWSGV